MTEHRSGRAQGPSTRSVHAGGPAREIGAAVVNPIHQTSTFFGDPEGQREVLYTRYGNNPNQKLLEDRIRALEEAEACAVTSSGVGAMAAAILSCAEAGDHVLAAQALYGGTRALLERELSRMGISASFVEIGAAGWEEAVRPNTRVLLLEIPTNPLLRVTDPEPIAAVGRKMGAAVLVDATFATPINFRGLQYGVDLIVHSATKYFGGHSDVTGGAVCGSAERIERVRMRSRLLGTALDPHAAWLIERGTKTLAIRMQRHNENGLAVARWCENRPEFSRVHYPGLPSHPDHTVAQRLLRGFGGMLALELRAGGDAATRFARALRLAALAPSLGGVETLVSEPRFTSHVNFTPAQREEMGIPDGFLRFSLGIEDADDIIADLEQALEASTDQR